MALKQFQEICPHQWSDWRRIQDYNNQDHGGDHHQAGRICYACDKRQTEDRHG